jgi:hypothetical protein
LSMESFNWKLCKLTVIKSIKVERLTSPVVFIKLYVVKSASLVPFLNLKRKTGSLPSVG